MLRTFRGTGLKTHGPVEPSPLFGTRKKVVSCLLHSVLEAAASAVCQLVFQPSACICAPVVLGVHSRSPAQHVNTFAQAKERASLDKTLRVGSSKVFKASLIRNPQFSWKGNGAMLALHQVAEASSSGEWESLSQCGNVEGVSETHRVTELMERHR